MSVTTTLPASVVLNDTGEAFTESGNTVIGGNSGEVIFDYDNSVASVSYNFLGTQIVINPGTGFANRTYALTTQLTITAVGGGSTSLVITANNTTVKTVEVTVTQAQQDDDEFLNKRGLTHFWENIDDLKQDKLTAGTNITISANNTISASQPTVGNATLTIQKNGTNVQTFTANATSNKTANITVPTTVAELSDSSNYATTTDLATKQNLLSPGNHISIASNVISATGYVHSENPQAAAAASSTITGSMIASGTITADKLASGATVQLTLSSSDIGEGSPLAANTLYGVYL